MEEKKVEKKTKKAKIIIIVVLVLCVFGRIANMDTKSTNNKVEEKIVYAIGENIACRDYDITINSFDIKTNNDSGYVPQDTEWVALSVTVENSSTSSIAFNEKNLQLINSNGQYFNPMTLTVNLWDMERLNNFKLAEGGSKTGYIVFNNTNFDNSNLKVLVKCSSFKEYTVDLK